MIGTYRYLQKRIFPVISENLYKLDDERSELTGDRQAACNLLTNPPQKIRYLLLQHQLAIEAELAAKWQRADFFWRQVQIELKALSKRKEVWQEFAKAVANVPEVRVMKDPVKLRQRLVNEIFIDTHCAFYNGIIAQTTTPSWKNRAFTHIEYIQQLLEVPFLSGRSAKELKILLGAVWEKRITVGKIAKNWRQTINYCHNLLKFLPNDIDLQNELAELFYLATNAKLTDEEYFDHPKFLQIGIHRLENNLKKNPYNLVSFSLISRLYYLQAMSLSTTLRLSESLVSIQKAITYNPLFLEAHTTRQYLIEIITKLREQWLSRQFTYKGQELLSEAKISFKPMNAYIDSDKARETTRAFQIAQAVDLYYSIGLPEPCHGWVESFAGVMRTPMPLQLLEAVNSVLAHPPQTKAELSRVWEAILENKPDLVRLNTARICDYLEHTLFEEGGCRVLITPPRGYSERPPILTPAFTEPQFSMKPFFLWLLSSQDKHIKLQVVIAIVLLVTTGYTAMQEKTKLANRESAYEMILEAKKIQYDEEVLKKSKEFFINTPLIGRDKRTSEVIEIFEESLVRWCLQQPESVRKNNEYLVLYIELQKTANTEEK